MKREKALMTNADKYKMFKKGINEFFAKNNNPEKLITPAHLAHYLDVSTSTLYNYRNKMDSYDNETYGTSHDKSFKTLFDEAYDQLEEGILNWMSIDPGKRATASALILNKYFKYRDDGVTTKNVNNFNGNTMVKVELPAEMKALAE